ncbi:pyridoxal phosphate-dependent decarboxylase family protein [Saccharospirillum salsuginis]|uniref:Aspartate aminotransferase family protein n=1 Tax=Saccharospirillum salsuginis TaxID=418750 RepID=A0A918NE70_9GAMM|nr:pyridoxal-dependent decarboxylase [Saccharospirillum salsuginis]GGX66048.1 aspartate aminotransferase family protein [Saccharospirillum salsuginis]
MTTEFDLLAYAERQAVDYVQSLEHRPVFPDEPARRALSGFDEPLPEQPQDAATILEQLSRLGGPATVASAGPNYYGFVIGSSLPVASAAERIALAWDQCASSAVNSPAADAIERTAARWLLDILDLPRNSAVGFGTSATAGALSALTTARRVLLARAGWDMDRQGLAGAPAIRVVCPENIHITVRKVLRLLGFGEDNIVNVPCDDRGRLCLDAVPALNDRTLLCLQAGEVNTGGFDPFAELLPRARKAGAWVHIDGAFGLWARASNTHAYLTEGIDLADSWTVDAHKWLNTPYDGAMVICRHADALAQAMNSDADYAQADPTAQKNLGLEFSRRARGIPIWAALKGLGRQGVAGMVERHCALAGRVAEGLSAAGYRVLNEVVLNQVLVRADTDEQTRAIVQAAQQSGQVWFGPSVWQNRPAFRISVSSWRTEERHIEALIGLLARLKHEMPS